MEQLQALQLAETGVYKPQPAIPTAQQRAEADLERQIQRIFQEKVAYEELGQERHSDELPIIAGESLQARDAPNFPITSKHPTRSLWYYKGTEPLLQSSDASIPLADDSQDYATEEVLVYRTSRVVKQHSQRREVVNASIA